MNDEDPKLISLADAVAIVWQARWIILLITLLTAAGFVAWSLLQARYLSQGYFQFGGPIPVVMDKDTALPGMAPASYSRYVATALSPDRLDEYLRDKKLDAMPGVEELREAFRKRGGPAGMIEPIYSFARLDGTETKGGVNSTVLGMRISYRSKSPELAKNIATILGQYAMDSIVYAMYADVFAVKDAELQARKARLENSVIFKNVQLADNAQKLRGLKEIISRYPPNSNQHAPMTLATEETVDYLPLPVLVTGTEVKAANLRNEMGRVARELQQIALLRSYYEEAKKSLDRSKSGDTILRGLESIKDNVFKGKDRQDTGVAQLYNGITLENQTAITTYLGTSRFAVSPNLPTHPVGRISSRLAGGVITGLWIALLFVSGRAWWRRNMQRPAS
jgi:hypothetical protein